MTKRVLVVDDVAEMRALIWRILSADGYQVDVAATLSEARDLDPAGYSAVLVDAHLGTEHGTELIEELRSADPAAVSRCLVITGGTADAGPAGLAVLTKPFRAADLLDAVRALQQAAPPPAPAGSAPAGSVPAPASAARTTAAGTRGGAGARTGTGIVFRAILGQSVTQPGPDQAPAGGHPGCAPGSAVTWSVSCTTGRFRNSLRALWKRR